MKRIYIFILLMVATLNGWSQQEKSMLLVAGDTPQLNELNPSYMPRASYISVPLVGGLAVGLTNSFSYNRAISDGVINLDKITDNSQFQMGANIDIIDFGVRFKERHMVNFAVRARNYTSIGYPTAIFDYVSDNPIDEQAQYDTSLSNMVIGWGEVAAGYTIQINNNWSFGFKAKYLMGMGMVNTGSSHITIDKSINSSEINGDVDIYLGGYDAASDSYGSPGLDNSGFATDLGVTYQSNDRRWSVGLSILDLGYIHWSGANSSAIRRVDSASHTFDGLGDLEETLNSGDLSDVLNDTYDEILASMNMDTVSVSFNKMLPTTIHLGATYDLTSKHTLSGNFLNYFYVGQPYNYSMTVGYTYYSFSGRFRAMASLTNRRYDPISLGAGVMSCTQGFQFYIMSDMSLCGIAGMKNLRSVGLRLGMNIFFGQERKQWPK